MWLQFRSLRCSANGQLSTKTLERSQRLGEPQDMINLSIPSDPIVCMISNPPTSSRFPSPLLSWTCLTHKVANGLPGLPIAQFKECFQSLPSIQFCRKGPTGWLPPLETPFPGPPTHTRLFRTPYCPDLTSLTQTHHIQHKTFHFSFSPPPASLGISAGKTANHPSPPPAPTPTSTNRG